MNGNLWKVISGIISTLIIAGLVWASGSTMQNTTDIAVLKSQFFDVKCNIQEIKDVVKEIRNDQLKRPYNK